MPARMAKKSAGSGVKPRSWETGEYGRYAPTTMTPSTAVRSGQLGRLRQNGTRWVRITNTTSVWVASDSTNHPERNSAGPAANGPSMIAKVRKSKIELMGPKISMNCRMNPMSQWEGRASSSGSTRSVGIVIWLVS